MLGGLQHAQRAVHGGLLHCPALLSPVGGGALQVLQIGETVDEAFRDTTYLYLTLCSLAGTSWSCTHDTSFTTSIGNMPQSTVHEGILTPVLEAEELGIYRGEHRKISLHFLRSAHQPSAKTYNRPQLRGE